MNRRAWAAVIALVLLSSGAVLLGIGPATGKEPVDACREPVHADHGCSHDDLAAVVETHGAGRALAELREVADRDPGTCHELAHHIGRAAAHHYGSIPAAYEFGDPVCGAAYFHGVAEGVVSGSAAPGLNVDAFCSGIRDPVLLEHRRIDCAHGVGHGLMVVHGGDLNAALRDCDRHTSERDRDACHAGVFMALHAAAARPGESPSSLDPDRPLHPCPTLARAHQDQCLQRQTSYALHVLGDDFAAVFSLCGELPIGTRPACHRGLGRDAAQQGLAEADVRREGRILALCGLPTDVASRVDCIGGAVAALVRFHRTTAVATALCDAVDPVLRDGCTTHTEVAIQFPER